MKTLSIIVALFALIVTVAPNAPFLSIASANAGERECKDRCYEKYIECVRKPDYEKLKCGDARDECEKDCEANAK